MSKYLKIFVGVAFSFVLLMSINSCKDSSTNPTDATTLDAVVTDATNNPVPDAVVEAFLGNTFIISDSTDENGAFSLHDLPPTPEKIIIRIKAKGFNDFEQELSKFFQDKKFGEDKKIKMMRGDSCKSYVSFFVKDSATGNPLGNVYIKIRIGQDIIAMGKTNEFGKISFGNFCAGEYGLRISKDGYKVIEKNMIVGENDTVNNVILLVKNPEIKCCSQLNILVKDNETNAPIAGAEVKLTKVGTEDKIIKTTNDDGFVSFNDLCTGKYWIRIAKDGYKVLEEDGISFEDCDTLNKSFGLKKMEQDTCCKSVLVIYPKDSITKEIINGAVVKLWKNGQLIKTITISNNQPATFYELCEGTYGVSINQENYNGKEATYSFGCNQAKTEILYLSKKQSDSCCDNKIIIYAKDSTGQAIVNAKVILYKNGQAIKYLLTNEYGRVAFEQLCTGTYGFNIVKEGYSTLEFQQEVGCHQTKELTKVLVKNLPCNTAILKFQTKDYDSGAILTNVKVVITLNGEVVAEGYTNNEGYFAKTGLTAPNTYVATFTYDGYQTRTIEMKFVECNTLMETAKLKKN
ncbi:MAG: MSCRAMM family protein [Candidatus Kapaibacteriota bacterium]